MLFHIDKKKIKGRKLSVSVTEVYRLLQNNSEVLPSFNLVIINVFVLVSEAQMVRIALRKCVIFDPRLCHEAEISEGWEPGGQEHVELVE